MLLTGEPSPQPYFDLSNDLDYLHKIPIRVTAGAVVVQGCALVHMSNKIIVQGTLVLETIR